MRPLGMLPFALLLAVLPQTGDAVGITFVRIADTSTAVPGGTDTFFNFGVPALDDGEVAFYGSSPSQPRGIYTNVGGSLKACSLPFVTQRSPASRALF